MFLEYNSNMPENDSFKSFPLSLLKSVAYRRDSSFATKASTNPARRPFVFCSIATESNDPQDALIWLLQLRAGGRCTSVGISGADSKVRSSLDSQPGVCFLQYRAANRRPNSFIVLPRNTSLSRSRLLYHSEPSPTPNIIGFIY